MSTFDLTTLLDGITITRSFQLSRNADEAKAKLGKTLTANFDFSLVSIQLALDKAVRQAVIDWQQANRINVDNFDDGENIGTVMVSEAGRKAPVDVQKVAANQFKAADRDGKIAQLVAITGMDENEAADLVDSQSS